MDPRPRHGMNRAQVVGHELRTRRAVQADRKQIDVLERGHECIRGLPGQHCSRRLNGARNDDGQFVSAFIENTLDGNQAGFDVAGVLPGFENEDVGSALGQPQRLRVVLPDHVIESQLRIERNWFSGRAHRAGHKAGLRGGREFFRRLARQHGGLAVQVAGLLLEAELLHVGGSAIERVGFDDIRAGLQVARIDVENNVGTARVQDLVAVLKRRAAEFFDREVVLVDSRPHGAVQDSNPLVEQLVEQFRSIDSVVHGNRQTGRGLRPRTGCLRGQGESKFGCGQVPAGGRWTNAQLSVKPALSACFFIIRTGSAIENSDRHRKAKRVFLVSLPKLSMRPVWRNRGFHSETGFLLQRGSARLIRSSSGFDRP